MEVSIYVQELLILWVISHVTYFFFWKALLFVSCCPAIITELCFLKERDSGRMRKKAQPQPVLPNALVLCKLRVLSCLFEHMQRSTALQMLKPLVARGDEPFHLLSNMERLFKVFAFLSVPLT